MKFAHVYAITGRPDVFSYGSQCGGVRTVCCTTTAAYIFALRGTLLNVRSPLRGPFRHYYSSNIIPRFKRRTGFCPRRPLFTDKFTAVRSLVAGLPIYFNYIVASMDAHPNILRLSITNSTLYMCTLF